MFYTLIETNDWISYYVQDAYVYHDPKIQQKIQYDLIFIKNKWKIVYAPGRHSKCSMFVYASSDRI